MRPLARGANCLHRALEGLERLGYRLLVPSVTIVIKGANEFIGRAIKTRSIEKRKSGLYNLGVRELRINSV
jgi:hypothetical protein